MYSRNGSSLKCFRQEQRESVKNGKRIPGTTIFKEVGRGEESDLNDIDLKNSGDISFFIARGGGCDSDRAGKRLRDTAML